MHVDNLADLLVFCSPLHTISPHAYNFLRSSRKMLLPHKATIRRACAAQDVSPSKEQTDEDFLRFMKGRAVFLNPHEGNMLLMMDKIHLQQFFSIKVVVLQGLLLIVLSQLIGLRGYSSVIAFIIQRRCSQTSVSNVQG